MADLLREDDATLYNVSFFILKTTVALENERVLGELAFPVTVGNSIHQPFAPS